MFYTSDQIAKEAIPPYGTGKDQGIPIIRIAGRALSVSLSPSLSLCRPLCLYVSPPFPPSHQGIPIIRIAGVTYKGTIDAFNGLGEKICKAAGKSPLECGCLRHEAPRNQ